jgi:hypothetical protein
LQDIEFARAGFSPASAFAWPYGRTKRDCAPAHAPKFFLVLHRTWPDLQRMKLLPGSLWPGPYRVGFVLAHPRKS